MVKYNKIRKPSRKSSKKPSRKPSRKYTLKNKRKQSKGCGCKLPRFFGGKTRKNKGKIHYARQNLKGGSGLAGLIPSDINNLGRSIMYTFDKNTAIMGGHDLPSNPSPVVQNEMDNH
jgi:hypothetical protein